MSDPASLSKIFLELRTGLARAISGLVPPKEIEDIVQETYVRVRESSNLERIRQPKSFLYKTARNLALDYRKRSESRLTDLEADVERLERVGDTLPDPTYQSVATSEEFAEFCDSVRYLPLQCRRAFVLRKVYGFSQKEIADIMGISQSTVEKHIGEGIKRTFLHVQRVANVGKRGAPAAVADLRPGSSRNSANE